MSFQVLLGSSMIVGATAVLWQSLRTAGAPSASIGVNLRRGYGAPDVRELALESSLGDRVVRPAVEVLARRARRISPVRSPERLDALLQAAAVNARWTVERLLALKLALAVGGGLMMLLRFVAAPSIGKLLFTAAVVRLGWWVPDFILKQRVKERAGRIQRELPDTMDQVTIAVEAGLGFEAALAKVAQGDSELARELARTLQDIQLGQSRAAALDDLARRVDIPELQHFVTSLRQAERFGLPIARVLRLQSSELREKRRQRAEEHAQKVPVKVLFPLMFCILPTLFILIIGPAVIRWTQSGLGG
jgi:tight adherence protein C